MQEMLFLHETGNTFSPEEHGYPVGDSLHVLSHTSARLVNHPQFVFKATMSRASEAEALGVSVLEDLYSTGYNHVPIKAIGSLHPVAADKSARFFIVDYLEGVTLDEAYRSRQSSALADAMGRSTRQVADFITPIFQDRKPIPCDVLAADQSMWAVAQGESAPDVYLVDIDYSAATYKEDASEYSMWAVFALEAMVERYIMARNLGHSFADGDLVAAYNAFDSFDWLVKNLESTTRLHGLNESYAWMAKYYGSVLRLAFRRDRLELLEDVLY